MRGPYDDIIELPHHVSATHPHMPMLDRAAQFSPFAALVGYDEAILETTRLTDEKTVLSEESKEELNQKLRIISEHLNDDPEVSITYFLPDTKKAGGAYVTATGYVNKIDLMEHCVYVREGPMIPIDNIYEIKGKLFDTIY